MVKRTACSELPFTLVITPSQNLVTMIPWLEAQLGRQVVCADRSCCTSAEIVDGAACILANAIHDESDFTLLATASERLVPVVFCVDRHDVAYGIQLLKRGAADVLTEQCTPTRLAQAIIAAWQLKTRVTEIVLCRQRMATLTSREQEVLGLLLNGMLNKQVAAELRICENTVKAHRKRIIAKTGASSLVRLARWMERSQPLAWVSDNTASNRSNRLLSPSHQFDLEALQLA